MEDGLTKARPSNTLFKVFFFFVFLYNKMKKKGKLGINSLCNIENYNLDNLGEKMEEEWKIELKNKKPSLERILRHIFKFELLFHLILYIIKDIILRSSQPLILNKLLNFYQSNDINTKNFKMWCFLFVVVMFFQVIINQYYMFVVEKLFVKIKMACSSLIYRKLLKINNLEKQDGFLNSLLWNDLEKIFLYLVHVHIGWGVFLQILLYATICWTETHWASYCGIPFLVVCYFLNDYFAGKIKQYKTKKAKETDKRTQLLSEIMNGIQLIKMYVWEEHFKSLIQKYRKCELKQIKKNYNIQSIQISINFFTLSTTVWMCVFVYSIILGNNFNPQYFFVWISLYGILKHLITMQHMLYKNSKAEYKVAIERLNEMLKSPEINKSTKTETNAENETEMPLLGHENQNSNPKIVMRNINIENNLNNINVENNLKNINFQAQQGELVAIVGPVGSKRSSLFEIILKEIPVNGNLNVEGTVSYASLEPLLFSVSIKENILFGEDCDEEKYKQVVKVCALDKDFDRFTNGDRTLIDERAANLSGGQKSRINLARAIYKDADIYLLDDLLSAVDANVRQQIFKECIQTFLKEKCVILITNNLQYIEKATRCYSINNEGLVSEYDSYKQFEINEKELIKLDQDTYKHEMNKIQDIKSNDEKIYKKSTNIRKTYFSSGGRIWFFFITVTFILTQVILTGNDYILKDWANKASYQNGIKKNIMYTVIIATLILFTIIRTKLLYKFCTNASKNLHNDMLNNVIKAPILFFSNNKSDIKNRFTNDMISIDDILPTVVLNACQSILLFMGFYFLTGLTDPWLFALIFLFLLMIPLKIAYEKVSPCMIQMEADLKNPIISHASTTLHGLMTIRAAGNQQKLIRKFDENYKLYSSALFTLKVTNRAYSFWLDFFCALNILFITLYVTFFEIFAGNAGFLLTQSIGLVGMLQFGIMQWSSMQNNMVKVKRIIEYSNIQPEEEPEKTKFELTEGTISFKSVSLKYPQEQKYALKNIDLKINSQEKIGIVGRTGAGKTSLLSCMFRLFEFEGDIFLDNTKIKEMSLKELRSSISIVTQDPVLFSGSLRTNLDPFDKHKDSDLWDVLDKVAIKQKFNNLTDDLPNLEHDHKQLICLARAMLRRNKILVLDEVTGKLDNRTNEVIQKTIREHFKECTVITIAHKLDDIMESDKVIVMENGEIAEVGNPQDLINSKNGFFYQLFHAENTI